MDNIFECGKEDSGMLTITIRRLPSEIPIHIDRALYLMALCTYMDGPAKRCVYRFYQSKESKDFKKAVEYLESYGWEKKKENL